jgi:hypothetical protein
MLRMNNAMRSGRINRDKKYRAFVFMGVILVFVKRVYIRKTKVPFFEEGLYLTPRPPLRAERGRIIIETLE